MSFSRIFKRTGTKSANKGRGEWTDSRSLPSAPLADKVIENPVSDDDKKKKTEKVDEEVGEPESSEPQPNKMKGKMTGDKDRIKTREGTSASAASASLSVYAAYWRKNLTYSMGAVQFSTTARFVPNGLPLFIIAHDAIELAAQTNYMNKNETTFNPYAAKTALAYLYYLQILRAKEAAGDLRSEERSALTRISKTVPFSSIHIPGPFVPYFESIVATELSDAKYEWVVPSFGSLNGADSYANLASTATLREVGLIRPNVPFMLAMLAEFALTPTNQINGRMTDGELYTPLDFNRTANANTVMFGTDYRMDDAAWNVGRANIQLFLQCGATEEFRFYSDDVSNAHKQIKRSRFLGDPLAGIIATTANMRTDGIDINIGADKAIPGTAGINYLHTKNVTTIDRFLFLEKEKNPNWTNYLFDNLAVLARHFKGNKTFDEISPIGGLESSVLCQLRTPTVHANGYLYDDVNLAVTGPAAVTWYRRNWTTNLTGYFRTVRGDIERNEELQALTFAINALPPVHGITETNFRTGEYFAHMAHGIDVDAQELGNSDDAVPGQIKMFQGWKNDAIRPQFTVKPIGF